MFASYPEYSANNQLTLKPGVQVPDIKQKVEDALPDAPNAGRGFIMPPEIGLGTTTKLLIAKPRPSNSIG